jgi:hypothetical protein
MGTRYRVKYDVDEKFVRIFKVVDGALSLNKRLQSIPRNKTTNSSTLDLQKLLDCGEEFYARVSRIVGHPLTLPEQTIAFSGRQYGIACFEEGLPLETDTDGVFRVAYRLGYTDLQKANKTEESI